MKRFAEAWEMGFCGGHLTTLNLRLGVNFGIYHLFWHLSMQCCCQGLETQGQGQGLDVQGRGQGRGVKLQGQGLHVQGQGQGLELRGQGQGLTPALIHTLFCMCNMKNNTFKTLFLGYLIF